MTNPRPPKTLSTEARRWWNRLQSEYPLADGAALFLLETALTAFDRMRQAQKAMEEQGATIKDRWGQVKPNPAAQIERDSRAGMLAAFKELRLDLEPLHPGPGRPTR